MCLVTSFDGSEIKQEDCPDASVCRGGPVNVDDTVYLLGYFCCDPDEEIDMGGVYREQNVRRKSKGEVKIYFNLLYFYKKNCLVLP